MNFASEMQQFLHPLVLESFLAVLSFAEVPISKGTIFLELFIHVHVHKMKTFRSESENLSDRIYFLLAEYTRIKHIR